MLKLLMLNFGSQCNNRCVFCNTHKMPPAQLRLADVHDVDDLLASAQMIDIGGYGEVTCHPDFEGIIALLTAKNKPFRFATNGTTLERWLPLLRRAPLRELRISMHSLVPETYRQLCGADHCEQVKRGVAALFAEPHDIDVLLVYCATSLNWPELLPTIDFAAQYDVALRWDDLTPTITYPAGLQVPDTPEHRAQVQRAYAVAASKQLRFSAFAFADRYPRDAPTAARRIQRCRAPFDTAGIEPNGNVVPCCWNSTCMGNIREKPLRAILDGPGYADIRRCIMAGDPKYCTKCGCEL